MAAPVSRVLIVVPPERFRDEELFVTQGVLEDAGHSMLVASTQAGTCPGSRGGSVMAVDLRSPQCVEFDALVLIGGGGTRLLFDNDELHELICSAVREGKVVAAICLAPVVLARAGVLAGRRATVAGTFATELERRGATYTGPGVCVDGKVVTANAPKASQAFGEAIVGTLPSLSCG